MYYLYCESYRLVGAVWVALIHYGALAVYSTGTHLAQFIYVLYSTLYIDMDIQR